jgi:hypothetical protein
MFSFVSSILSISDRRGFTVGATVGIRVSPRGPLTTWPAPLLKRLPKTLTWSHVAVTFLSFQFLQTIFSGRVAQNFRRVHDVMECPKRVKYQWHINNAPDVSSLRDLIPFVPFSKALKPKSEGKQWKWPRMKWSLLLSATQRTVHHHERTTAAFALSEGVWAVHRWH